MNGTVVSAGQKYSDVIYWSASMLLTNGYGNTSSHTFAEMGKKDKCISTSS